MKTDVYKRRPQATSVSDAYDSRLLVKLVRNYRSHPDILKVPNESFYMNELEACADVLVRESLCQWSELPKKGVPLIFHGVIGKDEREERSPSFFNTAEIAIVVDYVDKLLKTRPQKVLAKEIGIISPYRKQVWLYINFFFGISVALKHLCRVCHFYVDESNQVGVQFSRNTVQV